MLLCQALKAVASLQKEEKLTYYYYILNQHKTELRAIKNMEVKEGKLGWFREVIVRLKHVYMPTYRSKLSLDKKIMAMDYNV